jgi:hypothetical protein
MIVYEPKNFSFTCTNDFEVVVGNYKFNRNFQEVGAGSHNKIVGHLREKYVNSNQHLHENCNKLNRNHTNHGQTIIMKTTSTMSFVLEAWDVSNKAS